MRRLAGALLGFGLLVGSLRPVHAQSASEIAAAKQWFTEGLALEDKGQFAQALERFKRAAAVKKTPQILFHVGLCEQKTGALVEAIVSFERAAESAKAEGNAQVESAAQSELAALRPRVPMLELSVKGGAKPTSVTLDGNALSSAALEAPIPVNPGQHAIVADFAGTKVTRSFSASEGGKSRVELDAPRVEEPAPSPPPPPASAPAPKPPEEQPLPPPSEERSSAVVPWLVIGGGVLATAGGFYMWKLRGDQIDSLDAICPEPDTCPADRESEVDDLEGKGKTYTTLGIAFFGVGAAAIATGGYLLLSGSSEEKRGAARVAPALGPGLAGAVVSGRF